MRRIGIVLALNEFYSRFSFIFGKQIKNFMKNLYFLFITFFAYNLTWTQTLPIDFSVSQDNFTVFGGTSFTTQNDPNDNSNKVGRFVNSGFQWEGFFLDLNQGVNVDTDKVFSLRFYAFDNNNHTVILKLEQGDNAAVEVSQSISSPSANSWKNLSFDFSNANISGTSNSVNASGNYSRITIFIDGASSISGTYLIDDIDGGGEATDPNALDVVYNDLVWSDEFDTDGALDASKWHHQTFGPVGGGWYNNELQHYTDRLDNSFVSNGFLNIVAKKETIMLNGVSRDYTSARLNSKYAFTYGRIDVRAKLPSGDGTWPAIWTLGKNISEPGAWFQTQGFGDTSWPDCGELDIMEHGLHAANEISSAIHTRSSHGATVNVGTLQLTDVANTYHVYSMNWSPNQVTFLVDGVGFYTYKKPTDGSFVDVNNDSIDDRWPFFEDQFILLNIAMGGAGGSIDPNFTQSSMVIDYVRVYQNTTASTNDFLASKFTIYPNPVNDQFTISTTENVDEVKIYSMLGQLMHSEKRSKQIDTRQLKSGLYLLQINSDGRKITKKLLVE